MVNYCAVALCNNGSHQERINLSWSHNMADLSIFRFPGDGKLRKKWERFCRGADDKFKNLTDPLLWCCRSKDRVSHGMDKIIGQLH